MSHHWPPLSSLKTCVTYGTQCHAIGHHSHFPPNIQVCQACDSDHIPSFLPTKRYYLVCSIHILASSMKHYLNLRKNIFACLFSVHNTISLSRLVHDVINLLYYLNLLLVLNLLFHKLICWKSLVLTTRPHNFLTVCTL